MKIIKQVGIIFTVCWLSQVMAGVLPFDFPSSVIGMVFLLLCLLTGVLKIEHIQEKSDFLLSNMAFFFVPAGVSIMNYFDILKSSAVKLIIICVVSTVITFAVTAFCVKLTMGLMDRTRNQDRDEKRKRDYIGNRDGIGNRVKNGNEGER